MYLTIFIYLTDIDFQVSSTLLVQEAGWNRLNAALMGTLEYMIDTLLTDKYKGGENHRLKEPLEYRVFSGSSEITPWEK